MQILKLNNHALSTVKFRTIDLKREQAIAARASNIYESHVNL